MNNPDICLFLIGAFCDADKPDIFKGKWACAIFKSQFFKMVAASELSIKKYDVFVLKWPKASEEFKARIMLQINGEHYCSDGVVRLRAIGDVENQVLSLRSPTIATVPMNAADLERPPFDGFEVDQTKSVALLIEGVKALLKWSFGHLEGTPEYHEMWTSLWVNLMK